MMMMMMMKFERVDDVRCFKVCCVRASNFFYRGGGEILSACEKKGKKVLHRALEKALFCSSVKLFFFDEKVFKETRTNATLTTTTLIKKEKKTER